MCVCACAQDVVLPKGRASLGGREPVAALLTEGASGATKALRVLDGGQDMATAAPGAADAVVKAQRLCEQVRGVHVHGVRACLLLSLCAWVLAPEVAYACLCENRSATCVRVCVCVCAGLIHKFIRLLLAACIGLGVGLVFRLVFGLV